MQLVDLSLPGCFFLKWDPFVDERGCLFKPFSNSMFAPYVDDFVPKEFFFSRSVDKTLRGMHFQRPPCDHAKLVFCLEGAITDVVLDLRRQSPTFEEFLAVDLAPYNGIFIPRGVAHGFEVVQGPAHIGYATDTERNACSEDGILWSSFGYEWRSNPPIVSERDSRFVSLKNFDSPF